MKRTNCESCLGTGYVDLLEYEEEAELCDKCMGSGYFPPPFPSSETTYHDFAREFLIRSNVLQFLEPDPNKKFN